MTATPPPEHGKAGVRVSRPVRDVLETVQPFGSRPNAPSTFLEAGIDLSGYRDWASFCAIEQLPVLCDVCRSNT